MGYGVLSSEKTKSAIILIVLLRSILVKRDTTSKLTNLSSEEILELLIFDKI